MRYARGVQFAGDVPTGRPIRARRAPAMPICPFYREDQVARERRKKRRLEAAGAPPPVAAPWCAHLYSPVTKYIATIVSGGHERLCCSGDLAKCQVRPSRRPKI
jgi:hypothetical protein